MSQQKIRGNTQIMPATITDSEIASAAEIASSKLADGANFVKKDGSVAMTGDLNLGTHKITNVVDPVSDQDVATKHYVSGSSSYIHVQSSPSASWSITHALGYFPSVQVVDSAENLVSGDVQYLNSTQLTITFSGAFSGKAYLS